MTRLQHTIRRARRRHLLNRMLHAAGVGACMGIGAGLVLILLERLVLGGMNLSWHVYAAIAAVGLVLGAIWPALRVPELADIALHLDRVLRLKDRVATAHAMTSPAAPVQSLRTGPRYDDEFAELVRRDADRVAGIIDVRNVVPIRITGIWGAAIAAAIVFVGCFMFLPTVVWGEEPGFSPAERERITREQLEQRELEREELLTSIDEAVSEAREEAAVDDRVREQLAALERLSQQLQAAEGSEEDLQHLRDESAAAMNELSRRLAEQSQRDQMAAERLAERFGALDPPETPMTAEQFTEALKRGDFGRAADSLEELLERRERMSPDERRELAEHLQELSQLLDDAARREQQDLAERAAQLEQALRDQGLDQETIEQLLQDMPRSEEDIARELLDEQLDEDIAQRIARELKRLQEQREIARQAQQDTEAVNEALRDAAEQFDRDAADDPAEPLDEQSPEEPGDAAEPSDPTDDAREGEPGEAGEPSEQQPGQEASEQTPGQTAEQTQQETQQQEVDDPDSQQQREAAERQQGVEGDETREQAAEQGEAAQEAQQEGEAAPQPSDDPDAEGEAPQPSPDGEGDPTETAPAPGEGDAPDGEPAEQQTPGAQEDTQERSPGDALREMQQRRQAAQDRQQSSERMRERARQMAEGRQDRGDPTATESGSELTPMPGGTDGAGASSPQRPDDSAATEPWERTIEDIDLRDDDFDHGELIAEWIDEAGPMREGDPTTRRVEAEQRVRQAQEIAERAVNDAAVPSRYHERIRRYFGRLNETVDRAGRGERSDDAQP